MADYKLRLDVDAKLLEKNLEAAVKKAFGKIPSMSGGGMGGGMSGMGGNYQKQAQQMQQKLQKAGTKLSLTEIKQREKYIHDMKMVYIKEKAALRAHNIMLEKSGARAHQTFRSLGRLMGGRAGGAVGTGMDIGLSKLAGARSARTTRKNAQSTWDAANSSWGPGPMANISRGQRPEDNNDAFNTIMNQVDKFKGTGAGKAMGKNFNAFKKTKGGGAAVGIASKIPQAVKLAGIGAALAGGAGLGKMIVDSSPMLKSMLKLLNVGVMLILRPIGDFIGFMLRPLLLHFVKKVAIPAYKSGSKLAKEWGDKAGKVLMDLFTQPAVFMEKAIVNPIKGELEKGWNGMMTELAKIGIALSFWKSEADRKKEMEALDAELKTKNQITDGLYPGYGDMSQIAQLMEEEKSEIQGPLQETINNPQWYGSLESVFGDINADGKVTSEESAITNEKLDQLIAAAVAVEEIARTDANNVEQDRIMAECVATNAGYAKKTIMGSQAIEAAAVELEKSFCWNKAYATSQASGFSDGSEGLLSPEARKILARFNNYKQGIGEGTSAQASGRGGVSYGAISPEDMGQYYQSERSRTGTGAALGEGCYSQAEAQYISFGVSTREGAEAYSDAIQESAETGERVKDIFENIKKSTEDGFESTVQTTTQHKQIMALMIEGKEYMSEVNLAMRDMMMDIGAAASWVNSKLRVVSGYKTRDGNYTPAAKTARDVGDMNPISGGGTSRPMYRITFGDGTSKTQGMDPKSLKYFQDLYAKGGQYKGKSILSITKMAKGGVINEPIFGIGQNTGQGYLMGESGPETITPGVGTTNNGGATTFNITINASNTGDIERQLKPAILRMLKESTARAGIV